MKLFHMPFQPSFRPAGVVAHGALVVGVRVHVAVEVELAGRTEAADGAGVDGGAAGAVPADQPARQPARSSARSRSTHVAAHLAGQERRLRRRTQTRRPGEWWQQTRRRLTRRTDYPQSLVSDLFLKLVFLAMKMALRKTAKVMIRYGVHGMGQ